MRRERSATRETWTDLRAEISKAITLKGLSAADFRPLSIHEDWRQIEEKIYSTFCTLTHPVNRPIWLWTCFKQDVFSFVNLDQQPEYYLDKLVDKAELVWYVVLDSNDKFWFYEGKIESIQTIIREMWRAEIYIVSKKYEWLICINHHDYLIATGAIPPTILQNSGLEYQESKGQLPELRS